MKTSLILLASLLVAACSGSSSNDVLAPASETAKNDPAGDTSTDPPASTGDAAAKPVDPDETNDPAKTTPASPADCDAFAAKFCPKASACNHLVATTLGSACEERIAALCKAHLAAPGTGFTQGALTACGDAYTTMTCAQAFDDVQPAACNFTGTLPLNDACAFDDQCASGSCSGNDDDQCGKCSPKTSTPPTTTPKANLGEACDNAGQSAPQCNMTLGLWCDGATKTCAEIATVGAGQTCGFVGEALVLCDAGLACKYGSNGSGTCIATKPLGAACTKTGGFDDCAFGTSCLAGQCAYPTAAAICK